MPKFKFFVSWGKFSRIAQIFLKFANWKIQKFKNSSEKLLKNFYAFWQAKLKVWHAFSTMARQIEL